MSSTVLTFINIGLILTYILFGIAALGAVISGVRGLMTNPKGAKTALFGVAGVAVIILISMGLSSGSDISDILLDKTGTAHWWVRPVGAGLIAFYILFFCTVALVVATEAMKPFRK
ncbi:MAG: hypothetical protein LBP96_01295 [Bacteroidales bacterium]|jgi:hypothetical protein|nr:hypothetical protein [Bacteroidales bacterium]